VSAVTEWEPSRDHHASSIATACCQHSATTRARSAASPPVNTSCTRRRKSASSESRSSRMSFRSRPKSASTAARCCKCSKGCALRRALVRPATPGRLFQHERFRGIGDGKTIVVEGLCEMTAVAALPVLLQQFRDDLDGVRGRACPLKRQAQQVHPRQRFFLRRRTACVEPFIADHNPVLVPISAPQLQNGRHNSTAWVSRAWGIVK